MVPSSVRFAVERPARMDRVHVAIRVAILVVLGSVAWSSVYWLLYLALPALAALLVSQKGSARYLAEDAPAAARVLRWIAAAYAYLWLLTDAPPSTDARGPVDFRVEASGAPTPRSALSRLLTSVPAIVVLALVTLVAGLLWIVGAITILVNRRVPDAIADFLAQTIRYRLRLAAYHLSLVQEYPSLEDAPASHAPPSAHSGAA